MEKKEINRLKKAILQNRHTVEEKKPVQSAFDIWAEEEVPVDEDIWTEHDKVRFPSILFLLFFSQEHSSHQKIQR